tara:strand:+ start:382 stop:771 length:390 start_codon:yes stop_codon:yes gene_type:complete
MALMEEQEVIHLLGHLLHLAAVAADMVLTIPALQQRVTLEALEVAQGLVLTQALVVDQAMLAVILLLRVMPEVMEAHHLELALALVVGQERRGQHRLHLQLALMAVMEFRMITEQVLTSITVAAVQEPV